jgi:hypothetical protein
MYRQAQPQGGAAGAGPQPGGPPPGGDGAAHAEGKKKDEGVIDAEYVDVDEKK